VLLDLAFDYGRSGLFAEAAEILSNAVRLAKDGSLPMVLYGSGYFWRLQGYNTKGRTPLTRRQLGRVWTIVFHGVWKN
jgi:hypothetical protein